MVPAVSLLAAGGVMMLVRRASVGVRETVWVVGIAVVLVAEAFVAIPGLPMPTSWGAETEASAALSEGEGPVLIVPMGHGESEPDMRMLIDQVHHGRPLVNGPMVPGSSAAPQAFRDFAEAPAIQALLACENDAGSGGDQRGMGPADRARHRDSGVGPETGGGTAQWSGALRDLHPSHHGTARGRGGSLSSVFCAR